MTQTFEKEQLAMTRTFRVAVSVATLWACHAWTESWVRAQDTTTNVDVQNNNNFPIRVKRVGLSDGDEAVGDVQPGATTTFADVPFQGDQVFMAWSLDGRNKCVGTKSIDVRTASGNSILLLVTEGREMGAAQRPKAGGGGRPGNGGGNQPPKAGQEAFAQNLGVYYQPVRNNDGTFWVRITQPPAPNSPAAKLEFEPGDIITALDDQTFRTPQDVLNHTQQTTIDFIDVRTKERRRANVFIP